MGIILSVIQKGQAGFKVLMAYWLTNPTCCWYPKDRTAEFCRMIRPGLAHITVHNLVTVPIAVHTAGN